jgi:hypothetical protein
MPAPDPSTIVYCIACRKPMNGKGWFGAECMCDRPAGNALKGAHSTGQFQKRD